jgi:hypothetical protein
LQPRIQKPVLRGILLQQKILFKIRDAHNKTVKADADKIQSDTFKDVYDDLKTKMQKFVRQGRLLAANPLLQGAEYLDSVVRTPPPDEWDKNPTEWLSNYDINSIMKTTSSIPNSPLSGRRRWTSTKSPPTTTATACATICVISRCPTA